MQIVGPTNTLTHAQTDWRLYDQGDPEGQVGENFNKTIVTEKNSKRKEKTVTEKNVTKKM